MYEGGQTRTPSFVQAAARVFSREVVEKVYINSLRILRGCGREVDGMADVLESLNVGHAMEGNLDDMDMLAAELVA